MEINTLLRNYRKSRKLSAREFAITLGVSNFKLEKWEQGHAPRGEDLAKIKQYFGVKDFQNISEHFIEEFNPRLSLENVYEVVKLKDMLLDEKDKRIRNLEETVTFLREKVLESHTENKS